MEAVFMLHSGSCIEALLGSLIQLPLPRVRLYCIQSFVNACLTSLTEEFDPTNACQRLVQSLCATLVHNSMQIVKDSDE
jgi:hypothetical protein